MSSFWAKFTEPLPSAPVKPNNASAIFGGHSPYGLRATEPSIFRAKEKPNTTRKSGRSNSDAGLTKSSDKQKSKDSSSKRKLSEARSKSSSTQNTANKNRPVSPRSNGKECELEEKEEENDLTDSFDSSGSNGDRYPLFISVKKGSAATSEVKPRKPAVNGLTEDKPPQDQSTNGQDQKQQRKVKRSSSFSSPRKTSESVSSSSVQSKSAQPVKPRGVSNQHTGIPTKGRSPIDSFRREKSDIIVRPRGSSSPSSNRKENTVLSNSKSAYSPSALKREKSDITPRRTQQPPSGVLRENSDLVRPRGSASPGALRREKSDIVSPRRSPGIGKRQKSDITLKKKTNITPSSSTDTVNSCESRSEILNKVIDHKENMSKIPTPGGANPPSKIPSFTKTSGIPQSKIPPKSKIPSIGKADNKEDQQKTPQIPTGIPRSDKSTSKIPGPPRPDSAKENKDPEINRKDIEEEATKPVKNEIKVSRIPSAKGASKIPRQDSHGKKSTCAEDDTDNVFADEHEAVTNGNANEKVLTPQSRIPSRSGSSQTSNTPTGVSKIPSFSAKTNGASKPSLIKAPEVVSPVSKIPQHAGSGQSGIPSPTVHAKPEVAHSGIPAPTVHAKPEVAHSGIPAPSVHAKPEVAHSGIPAPTVHAKPEVALSGIPPPTVHPKPAVHSGIPPPSVHAKPDAGHSGIPSPTVHAKPEAFASGIPKPEVNNSTPVSGIPKPEVTASPITTESKIPQFSPTESVPKSKIPGPPGSLLTRKLSEEKFKKTTEKPAETPKEDTSAKASETPSTPEAAPAPVTTVATPSGKVAPPPPPRHDVKKEETNHEEVSQQDSPMDKYIFSEAKRIEELLRKEAIIVQVPSNEEKDEKPKDVEAKAEIAKLNFEKGPEANEMITGVGEVCKDKIKEPAKKEPVIFSTFGKKEDSGITVDKATPKETPKPDAVKEEVKKDTVLEEKKPLEEKAQEGKEKVVDVQSPTDENKPAIDTLGQYEQQARRSRSRQRKVISPESEQPETTFEQAASEDDTKKVIVKDKFGTQPFEGQETKDSEGKPASKPAKTKPKHDKPKFVIQSSLGADFYQSKTSQSKESIDEDTATKPAEVIVIENKSFDDSKSPKAAKSKDVKNNKKNQPKEQKETEAFEDVDLSSNKGSKMEMRAWSMEQLDEKTVKCACGRGGKCSIM